MKKLVLFLMIFTSFNAMAQVGGRTPPTTRLPSLDSAPDNSPAAFGMIAGVAYACKAGKKLEDFELIVSKLLANSAPSKEMENAFAKEYAQAKKASAIKQKTTPPMPCSRFLKEFNKQKIFQSMVFSDGSVKNPDGTWSLPRGQKEPPKGY